MIIPFLPQISEVDSKTDLHEAIEKHNVMFCVNSSKEHYCSPHISPFGVVYNVSGKQSFMINNKHVDLKSNKFRILNRGTDFGIEFNKADYRETVLLFFKKQQIINVMHVNNLKHNDLLDEYSCADVIHDEFFIERNYYSSDFFRLWINRFHEISSIKYIQADENKDIAIYVLLQYLYDLNSKSLKEIDKLKSVKFSTRKELYKRLYTACELMESTFFDNITLNKLAGAVNMNPYHFLRVFKELFGTTPHLFLTNIRLHKAKILLKESKLPISEICFLCGFESHSSFTNLFKRKFSISPTAFRSTN